MGCDFFVANDAFLIASPEYIASMPGVLKNVIDWVLPMGRNRSTGGRACCSRLRRRWPAAIEVCGRYGDRQEAERVS